MISQHDLVLVIDHGSPSAQVIARRVREAAVYSELIPGTTAIEEILERKPSAIILSGGAVSVHADDAPQLDPALFEAGVPVLGISHGFQAMAAALGGTVERTGTTEKGLTTLSILNAGCLLNTLPNTVNVWMDHEDAVTRPPEGFRTLARTAGAPVAAFEDRERLLAGVQWHPQDPESQWGQQVLEHFLFNMAQVEPTWTPENIVEQSIKQIQDTVGEKRVLCALSGGVDSAVAAALVQKAIGSQLTCVFVDHGLLREGEAEQVRSEFVRITGVDLVSADETERFLTALAGVSDPETKRKIIGREFIRTFEATAGALAGERGIDFLVQGTLYPDVVESGGGTGHENIKSHHNVGGLPDDLDFTLIEPLRNMFKDEVRAVGTQLGLPESLVWRHPFPGPGLGIRIIGEVTAERLDILRRADAIAREELAAARLEREIWQFPVVLLADVRSVGVLDQARTYGHPIVLRPVTSEDAMSAEWAQLPNELLARISSRITSEVPEVNRVVIDITNKPPGTIEWE